MFSPFRVDNSSRPRGLLTHPGCFPTGEQNLILSAAAAAAAGT